jgi:hypothetical protein
MDLLCGAGYRRALEFLIKDYLKSLSEETKHDVIDKAQLMFCITNFVTDPKLRLTASRATWLGNDETHYIRKWGDKDLSDLKKLIDLTVYWILSEMLTRELETSMPEPEVRGEGGMMATVTRTVKVNQSAVIKAENGEHRVEVYLELHQRFNEDQTTNDFDVPAPLDILGGSGRVVKWYGPRPATPASIPFELVLADG